MLNRGQIDAAFGVANQYAQAVCECVSERDMGEAATFLAQHEAIMDVLSAIDVPYSRILEARNSIRRQSDAIREWQKEKCREVLRRD